MKATGKTIALLSTSALAAGAARGAILYTPFNVTIPGGRDLTFDLNQDSIPDFKIASSSTKPVIDNSPAPASSFVLSASSNHGLPLTLAGALINSSYQSSQTNGYFNERTSDGAVVGSWTAPGDNEGYVGLKLVEGDGTHYGWAHFIYNATNSLPNVNATGTIRLIDAAIQTTPNTGILAGQTSDTNAPTVVVLPASQTGYLGGTAQMSVIAQGFPVPSYHWQAGAVGSGIYTNLPNGTGLGQGSYNALTLSNLKLANTADYVVVVSNSQGSVTSSAPATLDVEPTSDFPAVLVHRYSFQDTAGSPTCADSVGGSAWDGTLMGSAALTGSSLHLDGMSGSYVFLPPYIMSDYTAMTVEFWADIGAGNLDWTRVFSFGSSDGVNKTSGIDYCPGAPGDYQNLDLSNSGLGDYANNNPGIRGRNGIHVTVIVDPVNAALCYYNGTTNVSNLHSLAVPSLAGINDSSDMIGASLVPADPCLAATIYEFRVYQGVLPYSAIVLNDAVGPANYIELSANPALSASNSAGKIVLSWPASDYGFTVQAKSGVRSSTSWSTLTNAPVMVGTNWQVTLPATNTTRFFQLIH